MVDEAFRDRVFGGYARLDPVTRIFSARVQDGVIVADGLDLPDGTTVIVAANDDADEYDLPEVELADLDVAIAAADADESEPVPFEEVLGDLDRIHAPVSR